MAFLAWIVVGLIAVSLPAIIVAFIGAVILVGSIRLIKKASARPPTLVLLRFWDECHKGEGPSLV
jgi:hypothetical protein